MKKIFLSFAAIALVLNFSSCKENPADNTEANAVEVLEAPAEVEVAPVEEVEEVIDTTVAEDNLDTAPVE